MKRIILSILAVFAAFSAYSQSASIPDNGDGSINGRISGTVVDSLSKKALDYATVSLFTIGSKTPLTGVITDAKGVFKITGVKPGSYKITVSFMGYATRTVEPVTTTPAKPDVNMGNILIASGSNTLKEVSVVGQTGLVENKIDKLVYSVEKDITAAGGTARDVLGKVPMVSVDLNGNVSVRGDQNVKILINGKTTGASAANISDVLRSIPADQVKNIEVITSPSAKYDAEGSAGIINIITKQKSVSGFSGSVNGGIGTRQNNGNLNLNYNQGRFHLSGNVGAYFSWPQTSLSDFEQHIHNDTINSTTSTKGSGTSKDRATFSSVSAGYDFNAYNSINTTFRLEHWQFGTDGTSNTISDLPYSYSSNSENIFSNFDWNVDFTHKFRDSSEFDVSTQWSRGKGGNNFTNIYSDVFPDLKNNINSVNNEYTFQLDYTLPVSKLLKIEAGAKTIFRRISSTSDYYNGDGNGNFVFDPVNSNLYNYDQNVYSGYTVFTFTLPQKWSILAGLRDENTDIHGDPENATQALTPFSQNYNTFIPSLTLQKQVGSTNTLKLVYSKRIARPSLQYLNPFVNKSIPQSQSVGNPNLDPEISTTYEIDYNAFFGTSSLNTSFYYRHTSNLIEGITTPISVDIDGVTVGGTLTQYQNIGVNNSIGTNIYGSITPFKIFTISGNVNIFTYKPDPAGIYIKDQSQNKTYYMLHGHVRGTLTLPSNFIAEGFAWGGTSRHNIQGTSSAWNMYGFGVRKQFNQKKMSLGLNIVNPFSKYSHWDQRVNTPELTQANLNSYPSRSIGITFSYSFGKFTFSDSRKGKGINNDDMKQGGGQQGGGSGNSQ
jgi:outer membrane receptor protein involved in Fe transport